MFPLASTPSPGGTLKKAFVGKSGKLYVLRNEGLDLPGMVKYTMRESVDAYNNRTGYPEFVSIDEALADFDHEVSLDPETMKILGP